MEAIHFFKSLCRTRIARFCEIRTDGTTWFHDRSLMNKAVLILGDDESIRDFQAAFHKPFKGTVKC